MGQTFGFTFTIEDIQLIQKHTKYNCLSSSSYLVMIFFKFTCVTWKWATCNLSSFQTPMLFGKNPVFLDCTNFLNHLISRLKA